VSDNASNCVLANDLLADWSNIEATRNTSHEAEIDYDDDIVDQLLENNLNEEIDPTLKECMCKAFSLPTDAIGCHVHSLNLLLNDALVPIDEEIRSMREFVKFHKRNNATRRYLEKYTIDQQPAYFRLDGKTRWKYVFVL
jgi:hypothetical protein